MSTDSVFRGSRAVGTVIERMLALGEWLEKNRPDAHTITLRRRDLQLLQRWPQAAALHQVYTIDNVTHWRAFTLRADNSAPRFDASFQQERVTP